ncbi:MAG TPA: hypothetical protein VK615_01860, partial [Candidatus Binatia bacterium]|nr:hypothetical protein [Candidatus Binatia bacterium]
MKTWLTVLCILAAHAVRGVNVYVAVDGNDTWDGKAPNRAGDNGPKATLTGAIEAVRAARRAQPNLPEEVRIEVRGGTYELAEPIQIRPEDSGADANAPFVIRAYQNEKPVLSGGKQITGWKKIDGKPGWWQAEIPDVLEGKWYFRSLFIDGKRKQRARTPNEGFFRIQGESPQDKPVKLKFKPGEIKKEWTQSDVEVIALLAWSDFRMFIRDVDESNHVATLSRNPT